VMRGAWAAPGPGSRFPVGPAADAVSLPDEWALSRPGFGGSVWYRFQFETTLAAQPDKLLAAYIARACSAVEVQLNGQVLYRAGRVAQPVARQCYQSHVVPLPAFLLRSGDNQLDVRVSGYPLSRVTA